MSASQPMRVGVLGAAAIAWQAWYAIHETGNKVTYIGCRDAEKGAKFVHEVCSQLGIPEEDYPKIGSYDDVVSSEIVDVVYVPIPVTKRDVWVQKCIANNKHVVGEKPPAVDAEMLRQWIEALDARQLLYMDGTMLSHGERVNAVKKTLKDMGPIRFMYGTFCMGTTEEFLRNDIRLDPSLEPYGCLGDLGWYNVRYYLHLMDLEMPTEVNGRIIKQNEKGAIVEFSGELTFVKDGNTTVASFFCGFDSSLEQVLNIVTTEGSIEISDFVHPVNGAPASYTKIIEKSEKVGTNFQNTKATEKFTTDEITTTQRNNMWRDAAELLYRDEADNNRLKANSEKSRYWATLAWRTQAVLDKLLESARQNRVE